MRAKSMVLIMIAAGCGLVASIGISQVMDPNGTPAVDTEKIYVAMTAIDIGTKLNEANVRLEAWPKDRIPQGAISKFEELQDKYPRQRFFPDEPILLAKIGDQTGTNTDKIPEGYRVIPIKVSSDGSAIELLTPGDRIDVLAFFRKNSDVRATGCKTILRNVRVYSVGAATERIVDEKGVSRQALTVSLLVTPKQSQKVLMAMELGRLQFTLRNQTESNVVEESDEIDFQEFLSAPSENASQDRSKTAAGSAADSAEGAGNFADWLRSQLPAGGQAEPSELPSAGPSGTPAVQWQTVIVTPDSIEAFEWLDENALPQRGPARSIGNAPVKEQPAAAPNSFLGQKIELSGPLASGQMLDWNASRGKLTLVFVWQSSCTACQAELGMIKGLLQHYQAKGLAVVGVSVDRDANQARGFVVEQSLDWPNVVGPQNEAWATSYGVKQVPQLMLLDADGRLLSSAHRVVEIAAQVELGTRAARPASPVQPSEERETGEPAGTEPATDGESES